MYIYLQTECGCAVLGECWSYDVDSILAAIEDLRHEVSDLVGEGDLYCVCCGPEIPDVTSAPLSRYGRYKFGRMETMGGMTSAKS